LSRWWDDADEVQKQAIKNLLQAKQLEFIGGGWVMHDEAVNNAYTIVNQLSLGLKFLNETLEVRPKYEWHIDPFGHSLMMPELYESLQYNAIILNRIPNPLKQKMKGTKSLEFHWKSPYTNSLIFTHVLGQHYSTPSMIGLTMAEKAASLVKTCHKRLNWYRTPHLLLPFGHDFAFVNASLDFQNMEKIMKYINSRSDTFGLTMQFSTLDDYFNAVMNSNVQFPEMYGGDFFPYIACYPCLSEQCDGIEGATDTPCSYVISDAYWSGFYTSIPNQKLLVRNQESKTFNLELLDSFKHVKNDTIQDILNVSWKTSALLSHHDAITGTSFPPAFSDYNKQLFNAINLANDAIGTLKSYSLCKNNLPLLNSNISQTLTGLNGENMAAVVLFNPSAHKRSIYVKIEMPKSLCVEVMQASSDRKELVKINSQIIRTQLYIPIEIDQMGLQVIFLKKINCPNKKTQLPSSVVMDNGVIQLSFDEYNHLIGWKNFLTNESFTTSLNFTQYFEKEASDDFPHSVCDGSNVYTFVPDKGSKTLIPYNKDISMTQLASGPLVWEANQIISTDNTPIEITMRLYKPIVSGNSSDLHNNFIEIQPKVGPLSNIPNSISLLVSTDLNTKNSFTTYTSGIYPMLREYNMLQSIQGNFYPLVGRVSITDVGIQRSLVIATQRPMGVTANNGEIEALIHRRIPLWYDSRGDDATIVNDPMLVGITPSDSVDVVSLDAMEYLHSPLSVHVALVDNYEDWISNCNTMQTPPIKPFPQV
jgi:hypothetical protein